MQQPLQPVFELTQEQMAPAGTVDEALINYVNGPFRHWLREEQIDTGFHRSIRVYDTGTADEAKVYLLVIERYLTNSELGQRQRIAVDQDSGLPRSVIEAYWVSGPPPRLPGQ